MADILEDCCTQLRRRCVHAAPSGANAAAGVEARMIRAPDCRGICSDKLIAVLLPCLHSAASGLQTMLHVPSPRALLIASCNNTACCVPCRTLEGSLPCAKRTAEILRRVITQHKYADAAAAIDDIRSCGSKLQAAKPAGEGQGAEPVPRHDTILLLHARFHPAQLLVDCCKCVATTQLPSNP